MLPQARALYTDSTGILTSSRLQTQGGQLSFLQAELFFMVYFVLFVIVEILLRSPFHFLVQETKVTSKIQGIVLIHSLKKSKL